MKENNLYETESAIQNSYKPLKKALWYTPVAFLLPTAIIEVCKFTLQFIGELIYESGEYDLYDWMIPCSNLIIGFMSIILFGVATLLLSKIAFKNVDPEKKKKASAVTLLPFVGSWFYIILADYFADKVSRIIYLISDYEDAIYYLSEALSYVASIFCAIVIVVVLSLVTAKIFKKIENDNK